MKKVLFLMVLVFVGLASCGESPDKYNKRAYAVGDSLIRYTDIYFSLADDCSRMWRSVIFDKTYISPMFGLESYCSDFNTGIQRYREDIKILVESYVEKNKQIDSLFASIKDCPEESVSVFQNIKDLMVIKESAFNMMNNPEGSYQSYTANLNELYSNYKNIKSKIEIDKK